MSGGFGFLLDDAGTDAYVADIFAQGVGYWFGTGVLRDRAGAERGGQYSC